MVGDDEDDVIDDGDVRMGLVATMKGALVQMLKKRAVVSVPVVEEVRPEAWWSCVMMTMTGTSMVRSSTLAR